MFQRLSKVKFIPMIPGDFVLVCFLAAACLWLSGCTSAKTGIAFPPVVQAPTQVQHTGKIVWYDLFTHNLDATSRFYKTVLGWKFADTAPGTDQIKTVLLNGVPIGNAFRIVPVENGINESRWLTYLSVKDVDKAAGIVTENKGLVYSQPSELPGRGRVSVVIDPQKAIVGLLESSAGDPADTGIIENKWLGSELWSTDIEEAVKFYKALVGYERRPAVIGDRSPYNLLYVDGEPRAGIVKIPWKDVEPDWIPYVAVKDVIAVAEKARKAGGKVLIKPHREVREGLLAIIADPSGAVFAIQQMDAISTPNGEE